NIRQTGEMSHTVPASLIVGLVGADRQQTLQRRAFGSRGVGRAHWIAHANDVTALPSLREKGTHRNRKVISPETCRRTAPIEQRRKRRVVFDGNRNIEDR